MALAPQRAGEAGDLGPEYELPRLKQIAGRDFRGFYRMQIIPNMLEVSRIRRAAAVSDPQKRIEPFAHFPRIMGRDPRQVGREVRP